MARRRLTDRQKARIADIQERRRRRASAEAETIDTEVSPDRPVQQTGRVTVRHGRNLVVQSDADTEDIRCVFRANLGEVVCGDHVVWQSTGFREGIVVAVQPRRSALTRPNFSGEQKAIAANITQLVVVLASQPEPTGYLVDQYLVAADHIGVDALLCLNKADLLDETERADFMARFDQVFQRGGG